MYEYFIEIVEFWHVLYMFMLCMSPHICKMYYVYMYFCFNKMVCFVCLNCITPLHISNHTPPLQCTYHPHTTLPHISHHHCTPHITPPLYSIYHITTAPDISQNRPSLHFTYYTIHHHCTPIIKSYHQCTPHITQHHHCASHIT